jgi:hypothetical protein
MPIVRNSSGHEQIHVSNLSEIRVTTDALEDLHTSTNTSLSNIHSSLSNANHHEYSNDKVKLGSAGATAVIADSTYSPAADVDDRKGWVWTKLANDTAKFNYYMYGSTGSSHPWTLGDLKSLHMTCSVDKWDSVVSVPFIVVHTVPTGIGDAGAFYHSRRAYTLNLANNKIIVGEHINLYTINKPNLHNENRYIPLENIVNTGDCADSEVILFISVHSDSGALMGTKIHVNEMGFDLNNEIKRSIKLVT